MILVSATITNCACSDLRKVLTITWIASNYIFTLEEGYEAIHYTNLVTVPKFGQRKRDGAPLNFAVCIRCSLNNTITYTSFFNICIHPWKAKTSIFKEQFFGGIFWYIISSDYNNSPQVFGCDYTYRPGVLIKMLPNIAVNYILKHWGKLYIKEMLDIGLVRPPSIILFHWNNVLDAELLK